MKKSTIILVALGIYLITAGASYMFFSGGRLGKKQMSAPPPVKNADGTLAFDQNLPKTEPCPLNGAKYSTQQRAWWEKHRPLGIMIENHEDSRPQSGIASADIVYEAVAEGGITRFLTIFYCQDGKQVGPIRSARTYFIDFLSEYGSSPLYVHVGGANRDGPADAISQIEEYGWGNHNDMNQFSIGFPTFWRDYNRLGHETATEHTMYSTTQKLWDFAAKNRKLTTVDEEGTSWDEGFTPYTFKDDAKASTPDATSIHIEPWEGYKDYAVDWTYDKATNSYKRENGGQKHVDRNTNKQITAKNIVVLYMAETQLNDEEHHLLYRTKGNGKAVVFMDGKEIKANWSKKDRESKLTITDAAGKPIEFTRGTLWFTVLPLDGVLTAN